MNLEFCEDTSISEAQEAVKLATEMLGWGQWTGEEIDFLTRVENLEEWDLERLEEMHSARERERNLRR